MRKVLIAAALLALTAGPLSAQQTEGVRVSDAWARATPGRAPNGAAYLTLTNPGATADRLIAVSTSAADKAEVHEVIMEKGVMQMRPAGPLTIEPGKTVELKPGGYHLMLLGLKQPLKAGDKLPLTLTFEKAGARDVTAAIGAAGAMGPAGSTAKGNDPHAGHDMSQHKP